MARACPRDEIRALIEATPEGSLDQSSSESVAVLAHVESCASCRRFKAKLEAYQVYVEKLLALAKIPNAKQAAAEIVALETKIAKIQWSKVENRDAEKTYNKMTVEALAKLAPGFRVGIKRRVGAAGFGERLPSTHLRIGPGDDVIGGANIVASRFSSRTARMTAA